MNRWLVIVLILVGLAIIGGAGYFGYQASQPPRPTAVEAPPTIAVGHGDVTQTVTAPGQLVNTHQEAPGFAIAGRILEIPVKAGDAVKAGAVLARLDDTALQYALETAQTNLTSAQARLAKTKTPPSDASIAAARAAVASAQTAYSAAVSKYALKNDQITVAQANLEKMQIALQQAQAAYDRVAFESDIGMRPEAHALQQATIDYQSAQASYNLTAAEINDSAVQAAANGLAQARAALAALTAPVSPNDIAIDQAAVDNAELAVKQAQDARAQVTLRAPFDGIVQDVLAKEGDVVGAGTSVMQLLDPKALQVRSTVTEEDFPLVQTGQAAQLFFDAQPDLTVNGTVTSIIPLRDTSSTSPVYPILVALENMPAGLAPGMTVDASVQIAKRENVLRLPRALVHARGDGSAQVRVWANNQIQDRTIQTGLRGDQYVEITNGLNDGDLVVSR